MENLLEQRAYWLAEIVAMNRNVTERMNAAIKATEIYTEIDLYTRAFPEESSEKQRDHALTSVLSYPLSSGFFQELMIVLLISGDLDNAKYLWKRLAVELKSNTEMANLWKVRNELFNRNFIECYRVLDDIQWNEPIQPLIQPLRTVIQYRATNLICRSHISIAVDRASQILGFGDRTQEFLEFCRQHGWNIVDTYLYPKQENLPPRIDIDINQLESIARAIVQIEKRDVLPNSITGVRINA